MRVCAHLLERHDEVFGVLDHVLGAEALRRGLGGSLERVGDACVSEREGETKTRVVRW